ncbi:MAG: heme A synthase [Luteitalea sp.]|nr:heme A synthase [Luteitalea sp.]
MAAVARFAWFVLAYNVAVILWGAYVRASGSGAGCGNHWPLCNGDIVPRAPAIATLIELSHRLTSGVALILVLVLLVATLRTTGRRSTVGSGRHAARVGAWMALLFMLTEAGVGAGLVLFQLVADNATMARALFMAVHLVNTFILLGWLVLTAHWLSGGSSVRVSHRPGMSLLFGLGILGLLLASASGAVAALGDTLYPAASLTEGLRADLSSTSHLMIRLRVLHPVITIAVGVALVLIALRAPLAPGDRRGRLAARLVVGTTIVQLGAGLINVLLLAPIWMQLLHLLLADTVWLAFVLLGASALAVPQSSRTPAVALSPVEAGGAAATRLRRQSFP